MSVNPGTPCKMFRIVYSAYGGANLTSYVNTSFTIVREENLASWTAHYNGTHERTRFRVNSIEEV